MFSCPRTPLECSDQAIQNLALKSTVASGTIQNFADGAGRRSIIDSRAGGFPPTQGYVYARFNGNNLEALQLSDIQALDSMDWDMAFSRYVVRINSGDSGPSCVAAQVQPMGTSYENITAVPADFIPEQDDFLARSTCVFVDDGSGLGTSPRTYFSSYYTYSGCVAMTGRVYILRTHTGRHVKITIVTYYATEAAQTMCNASGSSGSSPGGTIRMRWQYLD